MELAEAVEFGYGLGSLCKLATYKSILGSHMARQLHNASTMQAKHQAIYQNYTATFPSHLTGEWKAHILKWNKDHTIKPDPYEEIETRR